MNQIKFEVNYSNHEPLRLGWLELLKNDVSNVVFSGVGGKITYVRQFTGLLDSKGNEIYAEDILEDNNGKQFRIYAFKGGFVIKASYWSESLEDLTETDQLIIQPLADIQTIAWIKDHCEIVGNAYQHKEL